MYCTTKRASPVAQLRTEAGENLNKTLDGVYPLIAGAVTEEQKERLLAHLKSEAEMFTPVGISAVDRTASYYITNGYWNGKRLDRAPVVRLENHAGPRRDGFCVEDR